MSILNFFQNGFRLVRGEDLNAVIADPSWNSLSGIVATPAGTVTTSKALLNPISQIDTVATSGDGVLLPKATAGNWFLLNNNGANPMQVFAAGGSTINGTAGATGVSQINGTVALYFCAVNGAWFSTALGSTTAGSFSTLVTSGLATLASLKLDTGTKTATAVAGAATLNKNAGVITTESLTTAAGATYTLTLTDSTIAATDQVFASVQLGSATTGMPVVTTVTPGAGQVVIVIQNIHASAALNGTLKISFAKLTN